MALLPTVGKNAPKRRPTLKGNVVIDVSHGDERARAWPRGRGKPKTAEEKRRQDKFAAANLATKYIAPQIAVDFTDAVKGTPLLPRDLLISQMYDRLASFILEDGKERFPMVARTDVSEALDALANQPGQILQRGEEWWEGRALGPGTVAPWQLVADVSIAAPATTVSVNNLGGYSEFQVLAWKVTQSATGGLVVSVSTNNGASFYKSNGNYERILADGTTTTSSGLGLHEGTSTAARSGLAVINSIPATGYPTLQSVNRPAVLAFVANANPINALQLWSNGAGNLNGGRFIVAAR